MKKQLFILLLLVSGNVLAQRAAVKTNLLHDVATAPSLAAEWAFASRWTDTRCCGKRLSVELCGQPEVEILDDAG